MFVLTIAEASIRLEELIDRALHDEKIVLVDPDRAETVVFLNKIDREKVRLVPISASFLEQASEG